jgi:hypothetical protein
MIDIEHQRDIDLSAEMVWEEIRHFDRVLKWVPRGDESTISVEGRGIGMVRNIRLATMGDVQHRLETFDDERRVFSYSLTGGKPLGMRDYSVVATVTPVDEGHCTIRWVGSMAADDGLDEVEIGRALELALENMTTGIIAVLKGEVAVFAQQPRVDY